jgi:hypothetical protein
MSLTASARLGVTPAPGGLNAVQEFLNTDAADRPDLLADAATAERWFSSVLADSDVATEDTGTFFVAFTERDLQKLAGLRARVRHAVSHRGRDDVSGAIIGAGVSVGLRQNGDGTVVAVPQGKGWRLVASLLLRESMLAQQTNVWSRLKICRNPVCFTAFYDHSRNNIGVWHDVHVCGNAINLRSSRARRQAAARDHAPAGHDAGHA